MLFRSVDSRKRSRLSEFSEFLEAADRVVVYDHHPASEDDIEADEAYVEPVGACATLLSEHLRRSERSVTEREATLMMLGIYADTGRLSFSSTTARDVEAAGYLMRQGARLPVVNRYLRDQFDLGQRKLLSELMFNDRELDVGAATITVARAELDGYVKGSADVVEHLMEMGGHEAMFAILGFKGGRRIQLIGRSRVPYVDVGEILGEFGGGGHPGAAGATCKDTTVAEVCEQLEQVLAAAEMNPTRVRDLMTSPVETVERDITLGECLELFDHWEISGAPVLKEGRLDGIVSRRDIRRAERQGKLDLPVSSHMSHEPVTVGPDESLEAALEMMTEGNFGRLPVYSGDKMVGIVTRTDILDRLYSE